MRLPQRIQPLLTLAAVVTAATPSVAAAPPQGVSPGSFERVATISDPCPTFNWQGLPGTAFYELVVYELVADSAAAAADLDQLVGDEVAYTRVPGGATGWTPPLEQCLVAGGRYAWFVRAVSDPDVVESDEWSPPLLFAIASAPSAREVEQAVSVLERYLELGSSPDAGASSRVPVPDGGARRFPSGGVKTAPRSVLTGPAAIRGEQPDPVGEAYGVVGVSGSTGGAGIGAANLGGGPDLVLDGSADGSADTTLRESGIDRPSASPQTFAVRNSGGGGLAFEVNGVITGDGSGLTGVVADEADTLDGEHGDFYRDASNLDSGMLSVYRYSAWADLKSEYRLDDADGDIAQNNGVKQQNLNADALDGQHGIYFTNASNITSGTLATPRYSAWDDLGAEGLLGDALYDLAQNNGNLQEYLNADQLDGLHGSAFAAAEHDHLGAEWTAYSGNGLKVTTWADDGVALHGDARSTTGIPTGVIGSAPNGTNGRGVYGAGQVGVYGYGDNMDAIAVLAHAFSASTAFAAYGGGNLIEGHHGEPGDAELRFEVTNMGNVYADGTYNSPAADLAEMLPAEPGIEPGDVLAVSADGALRCSSKPYDHAVVGVYSTRPAFVGGGDHLGEHGFAPLAIAGVVPVHACAEGGAIHPGDLLTSSSTPGHAMRAGEGAPLGTVIGKALDSLETDAGTIRALVTLQ